MHLDRFLRCFVRRRNIIVKKIRFIKDIYLLMINRIPRNGTLRTFIQAIDLCHIFLIQFEIIKIGIRLNTRRCDRLRKRDIAFRMV